MQIILYTAAGMEMHMCTHDSIDCNLLHFNCAGYGIPVSLHLHLHLQAPASRATAKMTSVKRVVKIFRDLTFFIFLRSSVKRGGWSTHTLYAINNRGD